MLASQQIGVNDIRMGKKRTRTNKSRIQKYTIFFFSYYGFGLNVPSLPYTSSHFGLYAYGSVLFCPQPLFFHSIELNNVLISVLFLRLVAGDILLDTRSVHGHIAFYYREEKRQWKRMHSNLVHAHKGNGIETNGWEKEMEKEWERRKNNDKSLPNSWCLSKHSLKAFM